MSFVCTACIPHTKDRSSLHLYRDVIDDCKLLRSRSFILLVFCARRIPGWLLRQMLLINAVSAAVGFIPFVGDVVLAMFKANSRNAALLEEFLRIRGEEFLKSERERAEDPGVVRPGAGREADEVVPGKKPERTQSGLSTATGWFRRGSKGSKKAKQQASATDTPAVPLPERGRFIEDVPSTIPAEGAKQK